jgi:uncharacterized membrane protein
MPERRGARVAGHPVHPMLVTLPVGLWTFSLVADVMLWLGSGAIWRDLALHALGVGLVGALVAAVPGFIDFLTITNAKVRALAVAHMVSMLVVVGLFAVSFWLRWIGTLGLLPVGVSALGLALLGIGAWLGGEMVFVHGQGMAPGATSTNDSHDESGLPRRRVA